MMSWVGASFSLVFSYLLFILSFCPVSGLSLTDSDRSEGGSDARRRADVPSVTDRKSVV